MSTPTVEGTWEITNTFIAKITHQGRVTIPLHVRTAYNLKQGDLVEVTIRKKRQP